MPELPPLPEDVRQALDELTMRVQQTFGLHLKQLILFGSAARGELRPDSDVDVLVVVDAPEDQARRKLSELTFPYLLHKGLFITAIPVSPARWEEMKARGKRFAKNIQREGIPLAARRGR